MIFAPTDSKTFIRERFTVTLNLKDGLNDMLLPEGSPCTRASSTSILPKVDNAKSELVDLTTEQLLAEF